MRRASAVLAAAALGAMVAVGAAPAAAAHVPAEGVHVSRPAVKAVPATTVVKPRPAVYLTFDDGPTPGGTAAVLSVLERRHARATFFVIGEQIAELPGLLRRMHRGGFAIGDHSWSHPDLRWRSTSEVRSQLVRTRSAIRRAVPGVPVTCFRPPYGATSAKVRSVATGLGLRQYLWNVDPEDWRNPGSDAVADRVISGLYPGAIVLMHDGAGHGGQAARALDRILNYISHRGWRTAVLPGCAVR